MTIDSKPTNPKDLIGSDKLPLHLWPQTATALGAVALLEGALKYGRANWRHAGVRASIYYDAAMRHWGAWFEGVAEREAHVLGDCDALHAARMRGVVARVVYGVVRRLRLAVDRHGSWSLL